MPEGPLLHGDLPVSYLHFSSLLVVAANRTVNVLVLCGVESKNVHNFDEIWMTLSQCITKK